MRRQGVMRGKAGPTSHEVFKGLASHRRCCSIDKISLHIQLDTTQAVGTLSHSLQNRKTMVLTFTDLMWTKKPPTLYFHVSSRNDQAESRYDYLFLKPFSYTWPAALLTHSMPLKRKCWSNVYPKDKLFEKAQPHTPVGGRRQRKHPGSGEGRK